MGSRAFSVFVVTCVIVVGPVARAMPDTVEASAFEKTTTTRVCPGRTAIGGTDVSNFNPNVDWRAVWRGGRGFGFIKATEGLTLVNKLFAKDWAGAKAAGLVRGAYHFFRPDRDPVAQANFFVKTVGTLSGTDLPLVMDWEVTSGRTPAEQIAAAQSFLNVVESATRKTPIIYASTGFVNALGNPKQFARYPLFLAHYNVSCASVPAPWTTWSFWQYGIGAVAGVPGPETDADLFNGTMDDLKGFAKAYAR